MLKNNKKEIVLINYKDTREEIIFQISDDLFHFKVNGLYQVEEVEKIRSVLFSAKENPKHYAVKEHADLNMKKYDNLLKEMVILAENRLGYTQLEKYGTMVGVYALISHVESPLYYHENINLMDLSPEKLMDIADVVCQTSTAYLSVVCPVLVLPEIYEILKLMAEAKKTSIPHEMQLFVNLLIQDMNKYHQVDLKQADCETIKKNKQVHSLLNITNENGEAFYCSQNLKQLIQHSEEDYIQMLHFINDVLRNQAQQFEKSKALVKE